MSKAIRVIIVLAEEMRVEERIIELPSLASIQKIVDGRVDLIRDLYVKGVQVDTWVNDEFLFRSDRQCFVGEFMIKGNAVLASYDPSSGDTIGLNDRITLADVQELVHFPDVHKLGTSMPS